MDNHRLTNKNSTYAEFEAAIYLILREEFPDKEEEIQRELHDIREMTKKHYEKGYSSGDEAWGISLNIE